MAQPVGPLVLHIPHKDWNKDPNEKQNYDEIERWSFRLPRGLIGSANQFSTVTIPAFSGTAQAVDYVSIPTPINFEVGRLYRITGQWPGIGTSGAYGDVMFITIVLYAQPGSIHDPSTPFTFLGGTYHVISQTAPGQWQGGGVVFDIFQPTPSLNGPFIAAVYADMRFGGPGQILGSQPPGQHGSITVEDMGVVP